MTSRFPRAVDVRFFVELDRFVVPFVFFFVDVDAISSTNLAWFI